METVKTAVILGVKQEEAIVRWVQRVFRAVKPFYTELKSGEATIHLHKSIKHKEPECISVETLF